MSLFLLPGTMACYAMYPECLELQSTACASFATYFRSARCGILLLLGGDIKTNPGPMTKEQELLLNQVLNTIHFADRPK